MEREKYRLFPRMGVDVGIYLGPYLQAELYWGLIDRRYGPVIRYGVDMDCCQHWEVADIDIREEYADAFVEAVVRAREEELADAQVFFSSTQSVDRERLRQALVELHVFCGLQDPSYLGGEVSLAYCMQKLGSRALDQDYFRGKSWRVPEE